MRRLTRLRDVDQLKISRHGNAIGWPRSSLTWSRAGVLRGEHGAATPAAPACSLGNGDKATRQNRYLVEPMTAWRYSGPRQEAQGNRFAATARKRDGPGLLASLSRSWSWSASIAVKGAGIVTVPLPGSSPSTRNSLDDRIVPLSSTHIHAVGVGTGLRSGRRWLVNVLSTSEAGCSVSNAHVSVLFADAGDGRVLRTAEQPRTWTRLAVGASYASYAHDRAGAAF